MCGLGQAGAVGKAVEGTFSLSLTVKAEEDSWYRWGVQIIISSLS